MRSAVARRPPAIRHVAQPAGVARAVRPVAATRVRSRIAPRAIGVAGAAFAFLISYAALTALHAGGWDPRPVRALSSIPLFARVVASSIVGLPGGLLLGWLLPHRAVRALPAVLAIGVAVASLAILVFA
jgi:hypothetical protein